MKVYCIVTVVEVDDANAVVLNAVDDARPLLCWQIEHHVQKWLMCQVLKVHHSLLR